MALTPIATGSAAGERRVRLLTLWVWAAGVSSTSLNRDFVHKDKSVSVIKGQGF